jgi:hypothetical protein
MPSAKYHRDQAQILAGLALSTNSLTEAKRFTLAAMEHLERAEAMDGAGTLEQHKSADHEGADHSWNRS